MFTPACPAGTSGPDHSRRSSTVALDEEPDVTAATAGAAPAKKEKKPIPGFAQLQRVGRSLMLPIASLPAAALLLRLGQPDMLGADGVAGWAGMGWMEPVAAVIGAAGDALFANLPLLFAVGVAVGFAKKSDGSTALAAVIGYLVLTRVLGAIAPMTAPWGGTFGAEADSGTVAADTGEPILTYTINYGVLGGIIIGIIAAVLYQKYYRIKLPTYLAFFGGRRFVPIVTAVSAIIAAVVLSFIYPVFDTVITGFGNWVTDPGNSVLGGFVFGTANRLLIPFGLHHLLNNLPWFQFGSFENAAGETVHGDIARFFAGDPTAGIFMTGFFPIMMFALPAAALAIWHTAKPARRKLTGGIMVSVAFTAFLTGITEPLEFAFAYVAFPLYVVHALLTGSSLALMNWLEYRSGFGFSAGAIDFLLNFRIAEQPLMILVFGLIYAVIYYFLFRLVITKFNLKTPGREDDGEGGVAAPSVFDEAQEAAAVTSGKRSAEEEAARDAAGRKR
ncbi:PTS transporter subunit EIIC [Actinomycetaceae bacterium Sa1BUA1]|uniref:PTS transporter subunit EIIC n=1 Tax=Oceanitalea stevensii TaxID=2763072 RepID=A0ABR8Z473_9MICO|nr:PTS transporter subunit EIIC [Oceanitalea stevensii]